MFTGFEAEVPSPQCSPSIIQYCQDSEIVRHPKYYLNEGTITILVEFHLFRIHGSLLSRESKKFNEVIEAHHKSCDGGGFDATENVLRLDNLQKEEFEALLSFFYEGMFDDYKPSLDDLLRLLSLSHVFDFPRVRKRAIREIDDGDFDVELDPVRKLPLAEEYGVEHWIVPCYEALCHRPKGLTIAEAHKLGVEMAHHVWTIRERTRSRWGRQTRKQEETNAWDFAMFDTASVKEIVQQVLTSTPPPPSPIATPNMVSLLPKAEAWHDILPPFEGPPVIAAENVPEIEFLFGAESPISPKKRPGRRKKSRVLAQFRIDD